jgi:hypothetical protein
MNHPPYLKEKARQLRIEKKLSLDEIQTATNSVGALGGRLTE